jgi:hypothetical protein
MKKSKNIISDWLDKYGDPEIDKKVEEELERMTNKEESKQDFTKEYEKQLNISDVSGSATTGCLSTDETTTSTTIWKCGWVSDNFSTYYLDENMVKHYR